MAGYFHYSSQPTTDMGLSATGYYDSYVEYVQRWVPNTFEVMRLGLGGVILLAGAHKLVAPAVWTAYAAPVVTAFWPEAVLSFEGFMVINGVVEVLFGLVLLIDRYTPLVAGVVALSLAGVVLNLAVGALATGKFVDVLIRDLGLTILAVGVTLESVRASAS